MDILVRIHFYYIKKEKENDLGNCLFQTLREESWEEKCGKVWQRVSMRNRQTNGVWLVLDPRTSLRRTIRKTCPRLTFDFGPIEISFHLSGPIYYRIGFVVCFETAFRSWGISPWRPSKWETLECRERWLRKFGMQNLFGSSCGVAKFDRNEVNVRTWKSSRLRRCQVPPAEPGPSSADSFLACPPFEKKEESLFLSKAHALLGSRAC